MVFRGQQASSILLADFSEVVSSLHRRSIRMCKISGTQPQYISRLFTSLSAVFLSSQNESKVRGGVSNWKGCQLEKRGTKGE
jgi:hypothetical protein